MQEHEARHHHASKQHKREVAEKNDCIRSLSQRSVAADAAQAAAEELAVSISSAYLRMKRTGEQVEWLFELQDPRAAQVGSLRIAQPCSALGPRHL